MYFLILFQIMGEREGEIVVLIGMITNCIYSRFDLEPAIWKIENNTGLDYSAMCYLICISY